MAELGVKGTVLCGTGRSMRLTVLDCTNGQASRGPEREEGKKRKWIPSINTWPVNTLPSTFYQALGL